MDALGTMPIFGIFFFTLLAFVLPVVIVALSLQASRHKREMLSRERLAAIEKGLELPVFEARGAPQMSPRGTAIVLMAVGVGLSLFFWVLVPRSESEAAVWGLGFIPGMIGVGMLVYWLTGGKREWERQQALDEELRRAYIDRLRGGPPTTRRDPVSPA